MGSDRIGGAMQALQPLRFTVTQVGAAPQSMAPGMVPGLTVPPGTFEQPRYGQPDPRVEFTGPVLTVEGVTRGLGLDPAEESGLQQYVRTLLTSDNEAVLRQSLVQYVASHGFDPVLRRAVVARASSLYRERGVAQGNAERIRQRVRGLTPDEVPMKIDLEKATFVLTEPAPAPGLAQRLLDLLALLQALAEGYRVLHWNAAGPTAYADHLLMERLYTTTVDEVDGLAEKIAGLPGGQGAIDATALAAATARHVATMNVSLAGMLEQEQRLCGTSLSWLGAVPDGLENFLQGVLDAHETHVYLLQQRTSGLTKAEPRGGKYHARVPKPDGGHRYFYSEAAFQRSPHAPVRGAEVLRDRMRKDLLDHVTDRGVDLATLQPLVDRYGEGPVTDLVKEMTSAGQLTFSGNVLSKPGARVEERPEVYRTSVAGKGGATIPEGSR